VERLNEFATGNLIPELTVLLDLSVQESRRRRNQREASAGTKEDRIESEADSFHERVRQSFLNQAKKDPSSWLVLDAGKAPIDLLVQLMTHLEKLKWPGF
jgi:dTMP kinase